MEMSDLKAAIWQKSSRSNGNGGNNCVEIAQLGNGVAVRNSKDKTGAVLMFTQDEWDAFVGGVQDGEFSSTAS